LRHSTCGSVQAIGRHFKNTGHNFGSNNGIPSMKDRKTGGQVHESAFWGNNRPFGTVPDEQKMELQRYEPLRLTP
jgi:hypothetical protein